ncbi:MAG: DinB family protein [Planctomycetota bacterium]|jgi:uncharacterized damage-inducible protein DinB
MTPYAKAILSSLEFRKPMLLRNVTPLSEEQMRWAPGPGRNSIAWQLWHIAEVEDNWIRALVTGEPLQFPFGVALDAARPEQYPSKSQLLEYLEDVRRITRGRLEATTEEQFERPVEDPDFGRVTVLDIWAGVATSFAWHAGQVAMTAKLLPSSPVPTQRFTLWQRHAGGSDG